MKDHSRSASIRSLNKGSPPSPGGHMGCSAAGIGRPSLGRNQGWLRRWRRDAAGSTVGGHKDLFAGFSSLEQLGEPVLELADSDLVATSLPAAHWAGRVYRRSW